LGVDGMLFMEMIEAAVVNNLDSLKVLVYVVDKSSTHLKPFLNRLVTARDSLYFNLGLLHVTSCPRIGKFLIEKGCNPNLCSEGMKVQPLHTLGSNNSEHMEAEECLHSYLDLAKIYLAHGADVNARSHFGQTPLYFATNKNFVELVALFLEHGADANVAAFNGLSPLHCASTIQVAKLLVEKGNARLDARVTSGYYIGKTPLETVPLLGDQDNLSSFIAGEYLFEAAIQRRKKRLNYLFNVLETSIAQGSYEESYQNPRSRSTSTTGGTKWRAVRDEFLKADAMISHSKPALIETHEQDLSEDFFKSYFMEMLELQPQFAYRLLEKCVTPWYRSVMLTANRYDLLLVGSPLSRENDVVGKIVDSEDWAAVSSPLIQWMIQTKVILSLRDRLLFEGVSFLFFVAMYFISTTTSPSSYALRLSALDPLYIANIMFIMAATARQIVIGSVHPRTRCGREFYTACTIEIKCILVLLSAVFETDIVTNRMAYVDVLPIIVLWWSLIKYIDLLIPSANIGLALFIIREMNRDLIRYLIILVGLTAAFAQALQIVLHHTQESMTIWKSFTYMYFSIFNPDVDFILNSAKLTTTQQTIAVALISVFCLLVSIIVLNLIIAVMSNTFEGIYEQSYQKTIMEHCKTIVHLDTFDQSASYISRKFNAMFGKKGPIPDYPSFPRYVYGGSLESHTQLAEHITLVVIPTDWLIKAGPVHERLRCGVSKQFLIRIVRFFFDIEQFVWPKDLKQDEGKACVEKVESISTSSVKWTSAKTEAERFKESRQQEFEHMMKISKSQEYTCIGNFNTIKTNKTL